MSIAVIERFIRSFKDECTRKILVPPDARQKGTTFAHEKRTTFWIV